MKVLISNLNPQATEKDLETLFVTYGSLHSVKIVRGYDSLESRGLAVVEFDERTAGETALARLNKSNYMDQRLAVSEIRAPFSFSAQTLVTRY